MGRLHRGARAHSMEEADAICSRIGISTSSTNCWRIGYLHATSTFTARVPTVNAINSILVQHFAAFIMAATIAIAATAVYQEGTEEEPHMLPYTARGRASGWWWGG